MKISLRLYSLYTPSQQIVFVTIASRYSDTSMFYGSAKRVILDSVSAVTSLVAHFFKKKLIAWEQVFKYLS